MSNVESGSNYPGNLFEPEEPEPQPGSDDHHEKDNEQDAPSEETPKTNPRPKIPPRFDPFGREGGNEDRRYT